MLTFICYMSLFKVSQLHSFSFINGLSLQPCLHLPRFRGGKKKKQKKKERKKESFLHLSGLAQLRQQQCWLQHPVGHRLLSDSTALRGTAGRAESDRVKMSAAGLADFTPKPTVLEAASHAF